VDANDPDEGVRKLLAVVGQRIPIRFELHPVCDVQVLRPMNRGGLGAQALNAELEAALNPPGELRVERFGWTYGPGDKVMQVTNNYEREVFNGDLDVVSGLDMEAGELTVSFVGALSSTASANWTSWCWPMPPLSTRRMGRNIRPW